MENSSLPFLSDPHDALREGLVTLKDDAANAHPVEAVQDSLASEMASTSARMMQQVYGSGLPARVQIETEILSRFERPPGLPSSRLGLESLNGTLDNFSFDSYLGQAADREGAPVDLHSAMEAKLGMRGTKPLRRGIF